MKLVEMQSIATDTLDYFIRTMPEVPFKADDVAIEFVPKVKMAERIRSLRMQYTQDKIINANQAQELSQSIDANTLIGRENSTVIARMISKRSAQTWRGVIFHELMHIYCAMHEMDHFVEADGSGNAPTGRKMTAAEKKHQRTLVHGHKVWSEFIAQYYTFIHTEITHPKYSEVSDYVDILLYFIGRMNDKKDKYSLSFACARLLTCSDVEETISMLKKTYDDMPAERRAALSCLFSLHEHLEAEKPWKISEDFIADLGNRYFSFLAANRQIV